MSNSHIYFQIWGNLRSYYVWQSSVPGVFLSKWNSLAFASSSLLKSAQSRFNAGEIADAAKMLKKFLASKNYSSAEFENGMRLFGVCQLLLGDEAGAKKAFHAVLSKNPNASLSKQEILDPSIAVLFNEIKASYRSASGRQTAKKSNNNPVPRPKKEPMPSAPKALARAPSAPASAPKAKSFTGIFVKCNAKNATVFANGIFIGTSDQDISLDAGSHKITISASGYEEVTRTFVVSTGQKLILNVRLLKEGEKERLAAIAAAKARAKKMQEADLAQEIAEMREQKQQARRKIKKKSNTGVDYGSELPAGAKPNKASQSLADEFFREQYEATPKPRVAPNPAYAQPYPYGAAQAQPPSSAPPSAAYGYQQLPPAQNEKSLFLAVLPFGSGQFQNGETGFGLAFMALDLAAAGAFFYYQKSQTDYQNNAPALCEEINDPQALCVPSSDYNKHLQNLGTAKWASLGTFLGLWIWGAVDGVMGMNRASPARSNPAYPRRPAYPQPAPVYPQPAPAYPVPAAPYPAAPYQDGGYGESIEVVPGRSGEVSWQRGLRARRLQSALGEFDKSDTKLAAIPVIDPYGNRYGLQIRLQF